MVVAVFIPEREDMESLIEVDFYGGGGVSALAKWKGAQDKFFYTAKRITWFVLRHNNALRAWKNV